MGITSLVVLIFEESNNYETIEVYGPFDTTKEAREWLDKNWKNSYFAYKIKRVKSLTNE